MRLSEIPSGAVPSEPVWRQRDVVLPRFEPFDVGVEKHARLAEPRPPIDQGDIRCCVSVSISTAMELLDHNADANSRALSPLFHYYVTRRDPTAITDLDFESGLLTASISGIARLGFHDKPMTRNGATLQPDGNAYADAANHRLGGGTGVNRHGYRRIYSGTEIEEWRNGLLNGHPVLLAFWLSHGYDEIATDSPRHGTNLTGAGVYAHAVVATGFSDQIQCFWVRDSRGRSFGDDGHWFLPYVLITPALIVESWIVTNITYNA